VKEKEKDEEVDYTKKITDYAVVFYENSKIPKAKIHQTKEQLEILLYIPEVILSTISTKFLGNTVNIYIYFLKKKKKKKKKKTIFFFKYILFFFSIYLFIYILKYFFT